MIANHGRSGGSGRLPRGVQAVLVAAVLAEILGDVTPDPGARLAGTLGCLSVLIALMVVMLTRLPPKEVRLLPPPLVRRGEHLLLALCGLPVLALPVGALMTDGSGLERTAFVAINLYVTAVMIYIVARNWPAKALSPT